MTFKLISNDYIFRYTPSQQGEAYNSGAKQRVIRMVELQKDPMSPPRFKINKKIPRGPPSPPAPVMHSPTRKVTVKDQQDWKIPPCISNWKNQKGYTIPLDKRLAADGRGLQQVLFFLGLESLQIFYPSFQSIGTHQREVFQASRVSVYCRQKSP
jgi:SNW domain-containing protein 1